MDYLTFGEQVKIVLSRKGMTIKELAERVEAYTGKPMSRQNMTQRLGRDNFQEQDMRLIAEILGCSFQLNILEVAPVIAQAEPIAEVMEVEAATSREITIGDLVAEEPESEVVAEEVSVDTEESATEAQAPEKQTKEKDRSGVFQGIKAFRKGKVSEPVENAEDTKEEIVGDINPYTGKEYQTNSVRTHPTRIGYVQVYDRVEHKWTDMTEWAFLGFQERKKVLLGKDYEPPVYLD